MTPKEKAIELYYKFTCCAPLHSDNKECALIAVDEIINCDSFFKTLQDSKYFIDYWCKVQEEIKIINNGRL